MTWNQDHFLTHIESARKGREQNPSLIAEFEKQIQGVAELWFKEGSARLNDRAVCVLPDVSAEAVLKALVKKLGMPAVEAVAVLGTTNLCEWDAIRMFNWWKPAPSQNQLRGLIVISPALLSIKDFAKHFVSAYEEIKQQQSWDL